MSTGRETERLIARLAVQAGPVRPLAAPWRRALLFLAGAVLVVGATVALRGLRPDLALVMAMPGRRLEWIASLATGVLATFAAFHLAVPGRSAWWTVLPAPAALLWLGALGYGTVMDVRMMGMAHGMAWQPSWDCLRAIIASTVPMAGLMFLLLRFATSARPGATAAHGTLAVAALAAAGATLSHALDTALMVLVWHIGTIALLVAVALAGGQRIFRLLGR